MAMPETPFAMRSSMMRRCSAAVPSDGILNSTSTLASSASACSQPLRAMVQKSAALFVTKASLNLFAGTPAGEQANDIKLGNANRQASVIRKRSMVCFLDEISDKLQFVG